mmetsp:Transcript_151100/g.275100  ORF Transcript_151100/g.275100 Transcript_151100/m.275100 type:complete len:455 (-) Transcript_151100:25-1389(-)
MELLRPGTAPCHRPGPEKWTEVDAVVRDMFSSAASAATSSNSMPQRPHTACVCARPVAVVVEEDANPCIVGAEDSDDDSDGASIDEEGPDPSPEEPVRPSTAAAVVASWQASLSSRLKEPDAAPLESPTQLRPRTAPAALWKVNGDNIVPVEEAPLVDPAPAKPRRAAPTLPSGDMLLLGGGLWNQSSQRSAIAATPSEEPAKAEASAAGSPTSGRAPPREIPKAVAKQLPKQCTFLPFGAGSRLPGRRAQGGARPAASGLTPSAAKMRSHVSWAQFTPMRRFNSTQPEAPAAASKHPAKQPELAEKATPVAESAAALVASSTPVPSAAQQQQMQQLQQLQQQPAPTLLASAAIAPKMPAAPADAHAPGDAAAVTEAPRRRKGPKYRVAPGGSRPLGAAPKAPREFMVLEFRTEPRVVPASRPSAHTEARANAALRFRPKSREWAAERETVAMR